MPGIRARRNLCVLLRYWADSWNPTTWEQGDFKDDQDTGEAELSILLSNWDFGTTRGSLADDAVPEPATLSLLALGGVMILKRRMV